VRRRVLPVVGQLAHPRGVLAPATGFILNIVNRPINRWTVSSLQLTGSEEILDVGFGGGVGLDLVHRRLTSGHVVGVDISEEMVDGAAMRFVQDPRAGNVRVLRADVSALPFAVSSFDRAYSVNGIFFWPDPAAGLAEIYRVLRPGGFVVIAGPAAAFVLARLAGLGPASPSGPREVRDIATRTGFCDVRLRRTAGAAMISGRRP
jgi:SAM-dependent methyltransferase